MSCGAHNVHGERPVNATPSSDNKAVACSVSQWAIRAEADRPNHAARLVALDAVNTRT